jgi:hypothetical protein
MFRSAPVSGKAVAFPEGPAAEAPAAPAPLFAVSGASGL